MKNEISLIQERFLTAKEVAKNYFNNKIAYARILELSKNGQLPCIKIGRRYYFMASALDEWTARNLTTPSWHKIK